MKAVVGYVRCSTSGQARDGVSIDLQVAKIQQYCQLNDLTLIGIYGDPGVSGKSVKARQGIQAVLHLAMKRRIGALIIYKLDRLARNTSEALEISRTLDRASVGLHSITEKLDTQSAVGRFYFTLLASLAEMERGIVSERTVAALRHKRANGEKTGGLVPYGFQAKRGMLIPDEREQRSIQRIRELRAEGHSYAGIADALTREGIPTRKGTPFRETQIIRILKAA
jgi:site-specific DNA recombinase